MFSFFSFIYFIQFVYNKISFVVSFPSNDCIFYFYSNFFFLWNLKNNISVHYYYCNLNKMVTWCERHIHSSHRNQIIRLNRKQLHDLQWKIREKSMQNKKFIHNWKSLNCSMRAQIDIKSLENRKWIERKAKK